MILLRICRFSNACYLKNIKVKSHYTESNVLLTLTRFKVGERKEKETGLNYVSHIFEECNILLVYRGHINAYANIKYWQNVIDEP